MFYIYGARESKGTDKAENLLIICQKEYKLFLYNEDFTFNQLQKLIPETQVVPHIFDGSKYVGGVKELYDYLYTMVKFDEDRNGGG